MGRRYVLCAVRPQRERHPALHSGARGLQRGHEGRVIEMSANRPVGEQPALTSRGERHLAARRTHHGRVQPATARSGACSPIGGWPGRPRRSLQAAAAARPDLSAVLCARTLMIARVKSRSAEARKTPTGLGIPFWAKEHQPAHASEEDRDCQEVDEHSLPVDRCRRPEEQGSPADVDARHEAVHVVRVRWASPRQQLQAVSARWRWRAAGGRGRRCRPATGPLAAITTPRCRGVGLGMGGQACSVGRTSSSPTAT